MRFFASLIACSIIVLCLFFVLTPTPSSQIDPQAESLPYFLKGPVYRFLYKHGYELFSSDLGSPMENRGEEYRKWLKYSLRIHNNGIYGSGTICYYDKGTNTAYIISCGHLFRGGEKTVEVQAFYKNDLKLEKVAIYEATVLAVSGTEDISFMSFKPDWSIDDYAPIAKEGYQITPGNTYYSCGCDGAREVACYLMKATGMEGRNLVLVENAPRHGRSGGGLMTADGYYVGICWGSTDPYNGTGKGLFVPLYRIHAFAKKEKLDFLLTADKPKKAAATLLPIINRTGGPAITRSDYVPLP